MGKSHSLLVPHSIDNGALRLAVDLETLVRYMHLVIFTYNECLLCHTQRQSAHAVRQHMTGKGHCRVDLEDGESEFRDFYESARRGGDEVGAEGGSSGEEDASEGEADVGSAAGEPLRLREGSLLLASGKLLSHRSAPAPKHHHHRPLSETQRPTRRAALAGAAAAAAAAASHTPSAPQPPDTTEDDGGDPPSPSPSLSPSTADNSRALTRLERRAEASGKSALAIAMSRMPLGDRAALAHLPPAEQRAIVLRQFKQQDKARHESRRYLSKVDLRGDMTAKKWTFFNIWPTC
jgi:pre-60S factor REI1